MRAGALIAVLALVTAAVPAVAQSASPSASSAPSKEGNPALSPEMAKLIHYVNTPAYMENVSTVVLGGERDITPECKTAKVVGRVGFSLLAPPSFKDGGDVPVSGAWKDRVRVDRCGSPVVHNVLVDVEADGPHVGLLLPGDTGLPVPLQFKALQSGAEAAIKGSGCRDPNRVIVSNTRHDKVLSPLKADAKGLLMAGKWREIWTFRSCGKTQPVAMVFSADGKGSATFKASPVK